MTTNDFKSLLESQRVHIRGEDTRNTDNRT